MLANLSASSIASEVELRLKIPITIDYQQTPPSIVKGLCNDCSILTCGCLISENLANQLSVPSPSFVCPICSSQQSSLLSPCHNMRDLSTFVIALKAELDASTPIQESSSVKRNVPNLSLLSAFHEAFKEVSSSALIESSITSKSPTAPRPIPNRHDSLSNYNPNESLPISSLKIGDDPLESPIQASVPSTSPTAMSFESQSNSFSRPKGLRSNLTRLLSSSPTIEKTSSLIANKKSNTPKEANKELLYAKNFPFYRKLYQYNIRHSGFSLHQKVFINTNLSLNLTKLTLLSEKKWEVYEIDQDKPENAPRLVCCGKNNGEHGANFDNLRKMRSNEIIKYSNFSDNSDESMELLKDWEHLFCRITENLLIISGTRGFLKILDLNNNGRTLYTYQCKFPIRCIDVSPNEQFISLGVTGKDKYTSMEQAFIILLRLQYIDSSCDETISEVSSLRKHVDYDDTAKTTSFSTIHSTFTSSDSNSLGTRRSLKITTFPFTLPYADPISILQFSPNSKYLSVATALESRFMAVSIVDPNRPVLVMKSQRKIDTSLESEGITDLNFFPDNRLMTLTSVSYDSVPIVIDSRITSISGLEAIARPRLRLKLDDVGSMIHKCCVSPRGDAIAYLDRSGTVYVVSSPSMNDNDNKRIAIVTDVASAYRMKEAASLRFDRSGYKLYVLDRKGILTIADFTAGTVEDQSVTRCKIIS